MGDGKLCRSVCRGEQLGLHGAGVVRVGQRDAAFSAPPAGQPIVERHAVLIEPGTPPGRYRLIAGLYDAVSGARLLVAGGDHVALGEVMVERPATALPPAAIRARYPADESIGPLKLLGYDRHALGAADKADASLARGAPLYVALYWQALEPPAGDWQYRLWLGPALWQDWTPIGGAYPTSQWAAGEIVRDQIAQFPPAELLAGRHRLKLEVRGPAEGQATISLGTVVRED